MLCKKVSVRNYLHLSLKGEFKKLYILFQDMFHLTKVSQFQKSYETVFAIGDVSTQD